MKQFVRYMLHNFQGFTGVYLVITAIRHIISHTITTELAIILIIIVFPKQSQLTILFFSSKLGLQLLEWLIKSI